MTLYEFLLKPSTIKLSRIVVFDENGKQLIFGVNAKFVESYMNCRLLKYCYNRQLDELELTIKTDTSKDLTLAWIIKELEISGSNTKQKVLERLKTASKEDLQDLKNSIKEEINKRSE